MSRIPGFTAENTLRSSAECYHFHAVVGTLSGTVEPAFIHGFATVVDVRAPGTRLREFLCIAQGCIWSFSGDCYCIH